MSGLARLGELWSTIEKWLFPMLEDELGELDDKHREFVAKAVWDFPTTRDLIDAVRHRPVLRHLCGWETPRRKPLTASRASGTIRVRWWDDAYIPKSSIESR